MSEREGYMLIILMVALFVLSIGLLVAAPIWQTQIQRENEEELIFRGNQFVEAIRLYQTKHPGGFPKTFEELLEERCLRKLYKDPMTEHGKWNVILHYEGTGQKINSSVQKILIVHENAFSAIQNPSIIGVVSTSTKKSIRIYYDNDSYDKWLFFFGQDQKKYPEIIYFGRAEKGS